MSSARYFVALTALACLCALAETRLAEPWADRGFINDHGPYRGVLIIGVPERPERRGQLENSLAEALSRTETDVLASLEIMPADVEITEESVKAALAGRNIDAVLLTRLFRVEEIDEVQGGDPGTKRSERDFALGLWRDFRDARDYALDAPVKTRLRVVLENNFYDLDSAELIWSVQSYSMDPRSADEIIKALSDLITDQLKEHKLIQ